MCVCVAGGATRSRAFRGDMQPINSPAAPTKEGENCDAGCVCVMERVPSLADICGDLQPHITSHHRENAQAHRVHSEIMASSEGQTATAIHTLTAAAPSPLTHFGGGGWGGGVLCVRACLICMSEELQRAIKKTLTFSVVFG